MLNQNKNMRKLINIINKLLGKSGVHLVSPDFNFIKKNIPIKVMPKDGDIVYLGSKNYEIKRVLHNFDDKNHIILIVVTELPQIIVADINITFDKDKV